jgi:hypothetical protein
MGTTDGIAVLVKRLRPVFIRRHGFPQFVQDSGILNRHSRDSRIILANFFAYDKGLNGFCSISEPAGLWLP